LDSNSLNIKKGMITVVGQINDNINGWNDKKRKILRNDWKKDLLVVYMVIIKKYNICTIYVSVSATRVIKLEGVSQHLMP